MEEIETIKSQRNSIEFEPFFEQGICDNSYNLNFDSKSESKNKLKYEQKLEEYISSKNLFEKSDINEIYNLLKVINQPVTIDVNKIGKKDYYYSSEKKRSLSIENKKNISNNEEEHSKECQEILHILQMPLNDKSDDDIAFKPLSKPIKIPLMGKIIVDISDIDNTSKYNNENENNNNFFCKGNN